MLAESKLEELERLAEAWANVMDGRRIGSGLNAARIGRSTTTTEDWKAIAAECDRLLTTRAERTAADIDDTTDADLEDLTEMDLMTINHPDPEKEHRLHAVLGCPYCEWLRSDPDPTGQGSYPRSYVGGHPEMPLHPFEDSGTGACLACERHELATGAALASALMAANYPGDSGEDVDRLVAELTKRGYVLALITELRAKEAVHE